MDIADVLYFAFLVATAVFGVYTYVMEWRRNLRRERYFQEAMSGMISAIEKVKKSEEAEPVPETLEEDRPVGPRRITLD